MSFFINSDFDSISVSAKDIVEFKSIYDDLKILKTLDPKKDFMEIRANTEILAETSNITRDYPNVKVVPQKKQKIEQEANLKKTFLSEDRKEIRTKLLKQSLKDQGLSKTDIIRGLEEVRKAELSLTH